MARPKALDNDTLQRVLDAADDLFSRRGYADVTLRDIGQASGVHHSSLYYYAPGGKEQLYADVMARNLARHRTGVEQALAGAGDDLRAQLLAVGRWFMSQPMLDMARMAHSDLRAISPSKIEALTAQAFTLHAPIIDALQAAIDRGEVRFNDPKLATYAFVSMVQGMKAIPVAYDAAVLDESLVRLVELLMSGLVGG
ncbi:MAG: TetR/AcrR family transcriptional regulator [Anaerolineae bacterium]|nr:TetR/AcrR family transcriptional regulator [Anaerolineae bacterium]